LIKILFLFFFLALILPIDFTYSFVQDEDVTLMDGNKTYIEQLTDTFNFCSQFLSKPVKKNI
jgi:hypothetical protein